MVWLWIYVGFVVLAVVGFALLTVGGFFAFLLVASDPDAFGGYGDYYVDQGSVNRAVEQPCDEMATAANEIQIFSTPSVGAASLHHFAEVGRGIPTAIDSVGDANGDALKWRDDWNTVLDAVDDYADKLATDGEGTFDMPVDGTGDPVISDMSGASEVWCNVPPIIAALNPRYEIY
jgi:hypothetical protein